MAEDKKIRISADLSQLRSLRDEATGLYRELNQLSTGAEKVDESIAKLKEQLALLGERNDLEELYGELRRRNAEIPSPEIPSTTDKPREITKLPETSIEASQYIEREISQDKDIEREVLQTPQPTPIERELKTPIESDLETLVEKDPKIVERKNPPVSTEIERPLQLPKDDSADKSLILQREITTEDSGHQPFKPKVHSEDTTEEVVQKTSGDQTNVHLSDQVIETPPIEPTPVRVERPLVDRKEGFEDKTADFVDEITGVKLSSRQTVDTNGSQLSEDRKGGVDILAVLEKWKDSLSQTDSQRNEILMNAADYLEEINKTVDSILGKLPDSTLTPSGNITPPKEPSKSGGISLEPGKPNRGLGLVGAITKANLLTNVITAGFEKIQEVWQITVNRHLRTLALGERKDYLDPISTVTDYTSYKGAQRADRYRWIPFIGKTAATEIETIANAESQKQGIGLRAAEQLEGQVRPYAQTFGVSLGQAERTAFREGGYAAGSLGMTAGQYSERRSQLVRAGGGRDFVSGVGESQSLMAAERLYGLSPQATNALQKSMRFAESDGTSTTSSSAVLRVFEQTMKELKKPFSEIASTIEESLDTFNRSVQDVLSKTGDFDAAKIAGSLAGIRSYTGAEGKQLERYQESFTGQAISQDEVTQALLLRTITRVDSSVKTYSDAMSKIEKIQEEPEVMRSFLKELQSLTTTNEQFINVLSAVFPKLSVSDIKEQVEKPGFNIDALFDKIMESTKKMQKESDKRNQFERDAARKTVGALESANASYQNKMAGYGASIAGDIAEIRKKLEKIEAKPEAANAIDKAVDYISDALIKASADLAPKKGEPMSLSLIKIIPSFMMNLTGTTLKRLFEEDE